MSRSWRDQRGDPQTIETFSPANAAAIMTMACQLSLTSALASTTSRAINSFGPIVGRVQACHATDDLDAARTVTPRLTAPEVRRLALAPSALPVFLKEPHHRRSLVLGASYARAIAIVVHAGLVQVQLLTDSVQIFGPVAVWPPEGSAWRWR